MDNKTDQADRLTKYKSFLRGSISRINLFQKKPANKKWMNRITLVGWLLLFAFILWGGWRYRAEIIPYLINVHGQSLVLALFFFFLAVASIIVGWIMIMQVFVSEIKPWTHIYIYCTTLAGRRIPGTVWYIGGRLAFYNKHGVSWFNTSLTSTIEIIILMVSGCIVSLVIFPFGLQLPTWLIVLLVLGAILGLAPLHPRVLAVILKRLGYSLDRRVEIKHVIGWVCAYAITWIAGGVMFYYLVDAFHPLTVNNLFFIVGAWTTSGVAGILTIFLPSSFGVTDISLTAFLTVLLPLPLAIAIALISRFSQSIIEVIISAFFYYFLHDYDSKTI